MKYEYIKDGNVSGAIRTKEEVIKTYQTVVKLDRFGIIPTLIEKEKTSLEMLKREGISEAVTKFQYVCSGVATKAACADNREEWEDESSDEEMGFGLFD